MKLDELKKLEDITQQQKEQVNALEQFVEDLNLDVTASQIQEMQRYNCGFYMNRFKDWLSKYRK